MSLIEVDIDSSELQLAGGLGMSSDSDAALYLIAV